MKCRKNFSFLWEAVEFLADTLVYIIEHGRHVANEKNSKIGFSWYEWLIMIILRAISIFFFLF